MRDAQKFGEVQHLLVAGVSWCQTGGELTRVSIFISASVFGCNGIGIHRQVVGGIHGSASGLQPRIVDHAREENRVGGPEMQQLIVQVTSRLKNRQMTFDWLV